VHLWRDLATVWKLAHRVNELEERWDEVQLVLADKMDQLDRLLRRLTLRANRPVEPLPPLDEPVRSNAGSNHDVVKTELRRKAGLI